MRTGCRSGSRRRRAGSRSRGRSSSATPRDALQPIEPLRVPSEQYEERPTRSRSRASTRSDGRSSRSRSVPVAIREPELGHDERGAERSDALTPRRPATSGTAARARRETAARAPSRAPRPRRVRSRSSGRAPPARPAAEPVQVRAASWSTVSRKAVTAVLVACRFWEPCPSASRRRARPGSERRGRAPSRGSRSGVAGRAGARCCPRRPPARLRGKGARRAPGRLRARRRPRAPRRPLATPDVGDGERDEHGRIELHRDRRAEQPKAEAVAVVHERGERAATSAAGQRSKRVRTTDPSSSGKAAVTASTATVRLRSRGGRGARPQSG